MSKRREESALETVRVENEDMRTRLAAAEEGLRAMRSAEAGGLVLVEEAVAARQQAVATAESSERYQSLFANMLEGYAYCQMLYEQGQPLDFVYLAVNPAFEKLTALKDVVGKRVTEVIPGIREANPELFEIYGRVALGGAPERFETYLDPLGIWFSVAVFSPAREQFVAVFDNITAHKQAAAHLGLQAAALEAAANAIVITDRDGVIQWANPAFSALTGYCLDEAVGRTPGELVGSGVQRQGFYEVMWRTILDGQVWRGEIVNRRKDGVLYYEDLTITPVPDKDGAIRHFVAVKQDITQHRRAEAALEASQAFAQSIVGSSLDMIIAVDQDRRIAEFNQAAQEAFGYRREDVLGKHVDLLYALPQESAQIHQTLQLEGRCVQEVLNRRKDGRVFPSLLSGSALHDAHGERVGFMGVSRDITAVKRREQEGQALQRVREEVWKMRDPDHIPHVLQALRRGLKEVGIPFQVCGVNLVTSSAPPVVESCNVKEGKLEVLHFEGPDAARIHRMWEGGRVVYRRDLEREDVYGERDQYARWSGSFRRSVLDVPFSHGTLAVNSPAPEAFTDDDIAFLEQLAQVLTEGFRRLDDLKAIEAERRQTEEHLKLSLGLQRVRNEILQMQTEEDWEKVVVAFEGNLRELVTFNACSVNVVDQSKHAATIYYALSGKVGARTVSNVAPALRQALETGRHVYRRNLKEVKAYEDEVGLWGQTIQSVVDVPYAGGTVAMNSLEADAFAEQDIQVLEQFAQVAAEANRRLQDIKALAEAEARFRQAQKLEALGRLAGGVAHDFNNLLTVINGYSQLLVAGLDGQDPRRQSAEEIRSASQRAESLVRQLLVFSRKQNLALEVLKLDEVVRGVEKMLRRVIGEDLELVVEPAAGMERVKADRGQMEQVLMNLAVNARDAMVQGGRLKIGTSVLEVGEEPHGESEVPPGRYVQLRVSDTGVGMDAAIRERIFEPFFTTKEPGKGTGLGLATVYGIVRQSGGHIQVVSAPGQGATFAIYLPCLGEEPSPAAGNAVSEEVLAGGTETVLVVDDHETVLGLVSRVLRGYGYAVLEAREGEEALRLAQEHPGAIELLITDVVMPEMDGVELARNLRAMRPETRVLYMSGHTQQMTDARNLRTAEAELLHKPFDADDLARKVRQVLDS